ncbi:MAG: DUF429 domain-containing protein [Alphaproteobacteria bacterium]
MRIRGIDFTSAPTRRTPITCADCRLDGPTLRLEGLRAIPDPAAFAALLAEPPPWVAGFDFPFGQSRRFIEGIGWPTDWEACARHVGDLSRPAFVAALEAYKRDRAAGDKEHRRETDRLTGAISPQKLYGVPVGRMYHAGAAALAAADLCVLPCRTRPVPRVAVEAYPALVARFLLGRTSYKSGSRSKPGLAHSAARRAILDGLTGARFAAAYGFTVTVPADEADRMVADPTGDWLDALLCAVQAAWAASRGDFGVVAGCDPLEGWIVDPSTAAPLA